MNQIIRETHNSTPQIHNFSLSTNIIKCITQFSKRQKKNDKNFRDTKKAFRNNELRKKQINKRR